MQHALALPNHALEQQSCDPTNATLRAYDINN